MKLKILELEGFRNYTHQRIVFGRGINILYGDNAQGKTNVVEAIHLLATGKSHRTRHLAELVQHGADQFSVEAVLQLPDRETRLHLSFGKKSGRSMMVNEVARARWSELLGQFHVLLFSPETMDVVKGGPAERRRFLDILLCQIDSRYLRSLQQYTAILRQKASALRERASFDQYRDMMPVWNEAMAKHGGYIAMRRRQVVERLAFHANAELNVLSSGNETLLIRLVTFDGKADPLSDGFFNESALSAVLLDKLQRMAQREELSGTCLVGIHRDEMLMALNDNAARVYASQGQQRSIALSLILAALKLYVEETGEMPLLLLDDVMSELDPHRQSYLLQVLEKTQTIITTTDRQTYKHRLPEDTVWFEVSQGTVVQEVPGVSLTPSGEKDKIDPDAPSRMHQQDL